MRWILVFIMLGLSGISCNELVERAVGDNIWGKCVNFTQTIGSITFNIPNSCIQLTEGPDCSVVVNLKISNAQIFNKQLDLSTTSRVCGIYNFNQGLPISCNVCIIVEDNSADASQQCVSVQPTCSTPGLPAIPLDPYNAGCFSNDKLAYVEQCRDAECPAPNGLICSSQGTCVNGVCNCFNSWYGRDCSVSSKLFEKCVRVDQLSGDVCTRLIFDSCNVKLQMVVIGGPLELPLYSQAFKVRNLGTVFRQDICTQDAGGCQVCLKWNDLEINNTIAHGCGVLNFVCQGFTIRSTPLGCFNDDQVIPQCFGTCPSDCSGHGDCNLGVCTCDSGWGTDDCSKPAPKCPKDCSKQGICSKGGSCICTLGFYGADCSSTSAVSSPSGINPAIVVVPLILIVALAVAIGGVVWYRKRKVAKASFNQFDLLEQDDSDTSLTESTIN